MLNRRERLGLGWSLVMVRHRRLDCYGIVLNCREGHEGVFGIADGSPPPAGPQAGRGEGVDMVMEEFSAAGKDANVSWAL
jgi:hypothetical protein